MAEKEERIYIDVENDDLDRLKHISMTRQEAIEKMAKALYLYMYGDTDYKTTQFEEMYLERAQVALNALLKKRT